MEIDTDSLPHALRQRGSRLCCGRRTGLPLLRRASLGEDWRQSRWGVGGVGDRTGRSSEMQRGRFGGCEDVPGAWGASLAHIVDWRKMCNPPWWRRQPWGEPWANASLPCTSWINV